MVHAVASAPPLIVWLGHIFLPLRHLTGQFESALLLTNIVADLVALWLINVVTRELGVRPLERMAAILACGGAGIFISLGHLFLVETVMCAAATFAMYVALRSDRVSVPRGAALLVLALSVGFLAKASSGIFLIPLTAYVIFSWWLGRGRVRPPVTRADAVPVILAGVAALSAVIWYAANWPQVVEHLVNATLAENTASFYGSPVDLSKKIPYWIGSLSLSISSFALLSSTLAAMIIWALVAAVYRARHRSVRRWIESGWDDGTLFALTLGAGVTGTIIVFSLQINEDVRFLITTAPMVAVLVGWSLNVLRIPLLSLGIVVFLACNAAINHLLSFGLNPLQATPYSYLRPPDLSGAERRYVDEAIGITCPQEAVDRWNMIAVSYRDMNANTASFTSAKIMFDLPRRCRYGDLGLMTDLGAALDRIAAIAPPFVVTLDAGRQPAPDFVNQLSRPVAEWLAQNPQFVPVMHLDNGLIVYRERNHTK
jgi:hypothetical protein